MWLKTIDDREQLDAEFATTLGASLKSVQSIRRQLAELPSQQLVRLWFSADECPAPLCDAVRTFQKVLRTRAAVFSWVYGPGVSIARDLLYVRLPSTEKRRLVNFVLGSMRPRFPWINSKLIHAMAFRPRAFESVSERIQLNRPELEPWGPLYRRAAIPKGSRRRFLWIPNPPLKRAQGVLLRLVGPPLQRLLLPCVYGAGAEGSGPVFRNAAAHLERSFIASFDLRDFFPSTRVMDVIRGIQYSARRSNIMVEVSDVPAYLANSPQLCQLNWTADATVLVARLATHRGRLPQGSPLSPLLANLAFAPYDEKIIAELTSEFGRDRFSYSRYFDDLTISLSAQCAQRRHLKTPAEVKDRCERILDCILEPSSYSLNRSKSRCSRSLCGHRVTGLIVRRHSIDLKRSLKRHLRTTIHRLARGDFVDEAKIWFHSRGRIEPVFEGITRGHRWPAVGIKKRRLSLERLAALMLRRVYPDLRITTLLRDWYPWQERFGADDTQVDGKRAWPIVEWILAALWRGSVSACRTGDNQFTVRQDRTDICTIEAESSLDFFSLGRESAIAVVEYWHYLRGVRAYLGSCPTEDEFHSVRQWCDRLDDQLFSIQILADDAVASTAAVRADEPVTLREEIEKLASRVTQEYSEFIRRIGISADHRLGLDEAKFRVVVHDDESFATWIKVANEMFIRRLPRWPSNDRRKGVEDRGFLMAYLRLKRDALYGLVSPKYGTIEEFERKYHLSVPNAGGFEYPQAQEKLLRSLLAYFEATTRRRRVLDGKADDWLNELTTNPWHGEIVDRLEKEVEGFAERHEKLRSTAESRRFFTQSSSRAFLRLRDEFVSAEADANSDRVWLHLFAVSKAIYVLVYEELEPTIWPNDPPKDAGIVNVSDWKRKQIWNAFRGEAGDKDEKLLKLIAQMRNREAHGESADRREEWVTIQHRISGTLGRSWTSKTGKKHSDYHDPDDLELWAHEGIIVKVEMLRAVNRWLDAILNRKPWDPAT